MACTSTGESTTNEHIYDSNATYFTEELTLDDFLYDFEYLVQSMEESFPFFEVAQRRYGIVFDDMVATTRNFITEFPHSLPYIRAMALETSINNNWWTLEQIEEKMDIFFPEGILTLDQHAFFGIIRFTFIDPLLWISNTRLDMHDGTNNFARHYSTYRATGNISLIHHLNQTFSNPRSLSFYSDQRNFIINNSSMSLTRVLDPFEIKTEILTANEVAYINIPNRMSKNFLDYRSVLLDFYEEISGFEHLIIDIRGNVGSATLPWQNLIIWSLLEDHESIPTIQLYAFFNNSLPDNYFGNGFLHNLSHLGSCGSRNVNFMPQGLYSETTNLIPISTIMEEDNL